MAHWLAACLFKPILSYSWYMDVLKERQFAVYCRQSCHLFSWYIVSAAVHDVDQKPPRICNNISGSMWLARLWSICCISSAIKPALYMINTTWMDIKMTGHSSNKTWLRLTFFFNFVPWPLWALICTINLHHYWVWFDCVSTKTQSFRSCVHFLCSF